MATILILAGGSWLRARSFDPTTPPPLTRAATIPVTLPDGRRVPLGQLIVAGRPTVINLWASWCGPCRQEAPVIAQWHRRFAGRVNLLYLNVRDDAATSGDLAEYMADVGLPERAYARLDDDRIPALTGAGNALVPRTLVFDRDGAPLATITGYKPLALDRVPALLDR